MILRGTPLRSVCKGLLEIALVGDALRRVLMYSGSMEMYGVPGRSVLRKKDTRVRIPSLASLKSFIVKAFFLRV